jgi:tyrosyl-tRNA synthetase
MVHSKEDLEFAQQATEILFGKATEEALTALSEQQLLEVMDGVPQVTYSKAALEGDGIDLITFFAESGIFPSKGEARKMLQSGGVSMNKNKIQGIEARLEATQLLNDKYVLFQKGKKQYYLAVFE